MRMTAGLRFTLVTALVAGGALALPPVAADAATTTATLIRTTSTGAWATPSPDPAGITYDAARKRLVISDSEVDEMPLYQGSNVFFASLTGAQTAGNVGWTTLPWSDEAAGISYVNPSLTLVSDDDADKIFFVQTDGNGRPASGTPASFSTRPDNGDPEDVTLDSDTTTNGHVLIIDGANTDVVDYSPGPNGRFDGSVAPGDDVRTVFDVGQYGVLDPEGIKYYPERNSILVLDNGSRAVYELNRQGALMNVVDISAGSPKSAAGITLAPATDGSGRTDAFIVDRGVDNNSDAAENDGRLYEMDLRLPPLSDNTAPRVSAGPDMTVTLPNSASLAGSVTDDGRPNPPAAVTAAWTKVSGPGTVTFAQANSASTTATFSAEGSYVLRLTGNDSSLSASDDVAIAVAAAGTLDVPVRAGTDDAEQKSGSTATVGDDLELTTDGTTVQTVGLRFTGVAVPKGAKITNAYVQFQADEVTTAAANLTVAGQAADNPATFTTVSKDVSNRPRTAASVGWVPAPWTTVAARGVDQRTPNLAPVVQEIVNRSGWVSGNALALVITGTGTRTAESFEGGAARAPVLHLEFGGGTAPTNAAPTVSAGPDRSVVRPNAATLSGSVTDDGRPAGSTATGTWTKQSGAGTVTFASATSPSTTATFSQAGTYVLRLTGTDGQLTSTDDVTVTVTEATPGGGTGTPGVLDLPIRASADDAEEVASSGAVGLTSGDLNLVTDGTRVQTVGLRFTGVTLPAGATITRAYVQFQVDEVSTEAAGLTVAGQAAGNAATFTTAVRDVSSRPRTSATVAWNPVTWPTANARTADQRTPDLSAVLRQIVASPGWASGNAMVLVITGTGTRIAESFDGGTAKAPVLHIEYTV